MTLYQSSSYYFRSLLLLLITFSSISLLAQTGLIRGHAYDLDTGEPITFGNAILEGTTIGTNTDIDGFFTLTDVPVGTYQLQISFIGYETTSTEVKVKDGGVVYKKIMVSPGGVQLEAVNISARREAARTEVQISKLEVSQKQIKALPSTGGDADILQYLQVIPGVISTGDQGGQIFIRGGSPIQNKIMLDGMTIYNPFHSVGFYSIFETELIKKVDVLTGGFNAEHGGRISAVVDINTRAGNSKRLAGQISASPFMVKALVEGPIVKLQENKGSTSFVLTGKRSIIDQTSKSLYQNASVNDTIGLPFMFNDLYGKISFRSNNGSKANVFGFNFTDDYNNPEVANIGWQTSGGGLNFNILPSSSSLIVGGLAGYSKYKTQIIEAQGTPRSSEIREFFFSVDFGIFDGNYELKYGAEVKSIFTNFNFTNQFNVSLEQFQNTTELSGFVKFRQSWDKLVIEPSVRLQYYASLPEGSVEPRFGLKYNIQDYLRFKLAAGIYSQNLISASNERDVVNLFTGFLSGPDQRFNDLNGEPVTSKLQKSQHLVAGFEVDFLKNFQVNLEGYVKNFPQLIVVNRNKIDLEDPNFATETGIAYGGDISIKYETKNWYLWTTYALGFVNRNDGEQTYRTVFDRRHNMNFLASYDFGADWQVSVRYNFGTGFPFTQTQSFYNYQPFQEGASTPYETNNSENIGIIYADERNGGELPNYHRVDLSAQKIIKFNKNLNAVVVASVTNASDRENIFYFDRVRYERVNQLPLLPSLGIKFNF